MRNGLAARYLRGAKGDIVARRSATIAYTRPGFQSVKETTQCSFQAYINFQDALQATVSTISWSSATPTLKASEWLRTRA